MKRSSIVLIVSLVLAAVFVSTAFAGIDDFSVVSYDDTMADGYDVVAGERGSLIRNGDFSFWVNNAPENWNVWSDPYGAGWEKAHLAQEDLAIPGSENANYGLGMFVRNVGGSGSFYVGASQELDLLPEAGDYWVTIHGTMWGEYWFFDALNLRFTESAYNSVAWYGLGDSKDPDSESEWRELVITPWSGGTIPCHNEDQACAYIARSETVHIEPGQYLHIKAGHKFSHFNYWTLFTFDDISIVAADGSTLEDGHLHDGDIYWDRTESR